MSLAVVSDDDDDDDDVAFDTGHLYFLLSFS